MELTESFKSTGIGRHDFNLKVFFIKNVGVSTVKNNSHSVTSKNLNENILIIFVKKTKRVEKFYINHYY